MRTVFGLIVAAYAAVWIKTLFELPDRVPLHFTLDGTVDRWGSRASALILFALVGAGIAAVMGGMAVAAARGRLKWFNVPHKAWWTQTPERVRRAGRMIANDLLIIGSLVLAALIVLQVATVYIARRETTEAVGAGPFVVAGGCLAAALAWSVWMALVRYRPPDGADWSASDGRG